MVGKSRFGGLFSILNRRDIQTIKDVETYLELADPDIEEDMLPLADNKIQDLSINEIIDGIESYIEYIQIDRGEVKGNTESDPYFQEVAKENWEYQMNLEKGLSSEQRGKLGQEKGKGRYWESKLKSILGKLKPLQTQDDVNI